MTFAIIEFKEPFDVEAYCELRRLIKLSNLKTQVDEITLFDNDTIQKLAKEFEKLLLPDASHFYEQKEHSKKVDDVVKDAFPCTTGGS